MTADGRAWLGTKLEEDDHLREVLTRAFVEELMAVEVEARCRADTGERVNRRNGYRAGVFTMPSGSIPVRIPKLRHGGYAPQWLADGPDGAEDVLAAALCQGYAEGMSSDLVARLAGAVGISELSATQKSTIAAGIDARIAAEQELRRDLAARGLRGEVPQAIERQAAPAGHPAVTIVVRYHGRSSVDDLVDTDEPGSRRRRRIPLLIAAVAGLVLIVAIVIGSSATGRFGSDPAPTPAPVPTDAPSRASPLATTPPTTAAPTSAPVAIVAPTTVPPECIDGTQRVPWMEQVQCEAVRGSPTG